jgi:hypothetical protein
MVINCLTLKNCVLMISFGLIIFGTCVVSGGLGFAALACEDSKGKKNDSYRGGYYPWTDDRYPY